MLLAHLLVAGVVDFALTAGVVAYLQRANLPILRINHPAVPETEVGLPAPRKLGLRGAFIGFAAMVILVPLGLLATGTAFGEDGPDQLDLRNYGLNAVPKGLSRYTDWWSRSLFPGYDFKSGDHPTVGYYASAVVGSLLIAAVIFGLFRLVQALSRTRDVSGEEDAAEIDLEPSHAR